MILQESDTPQDKSLRQDFNMRKYKFTNQKKDTRGLLDILEEEDDKLQANEDWNHS